MTWYEICTVFLMIHFCINLPVRIKWEMKMRRAERELERFRGRGL